MKGVTPIVATVLLIFIGIGAVSGAYVYSNNIMQDSKPDFTLNIDNLNAETCYRTNLRTKFVVRNSNEEAINTSLSEVYINDQRTEAENISEDIVGPGQSFTVTMPPEVEVNITDSVKIFYGDSFFNILCEDFERPSVSSAFSEGGDRINSIYFSNSIVPRTSSTSLCIGDTCPQSTGNGPTSQFDTTNEFVNLKGDAINGSLIADSATGSGNVCFGDNCPVNEGSNTEYLTGQNNNVEGTLLLESFRTQNLCVGQNC